jgi:hypothetical protein
LQEIVLCVKVNQVGDVVLFQAASLAFIGIAQQSVHWTLGILRGLQAFFWLRVFPAPKQSPRPPQRQ